MCPEQKKQQQKLGDVCLTPPPWMEKATRHTTPQSFISMITSISSLPLRHTNHYPQSVLNEPTPPPLVQARPRSQKSRQSGSTPTPCCRHPWYPTSRKSQCKVPGLAASRCNKSCDVSGSAAEPRHQSYIVRTHPVQLPSRFGSVRLEALRTFSTLD